MPATITSLNGDGVTQLPPHLGLYDYYAIKWAYQPIFEAKTPEEEVPVLNRWIDEKADDPIYIYGEQAIFGATDPASQTESLGDDAMKATEYGIRNLKIVVDSLHLWTAYPGKDYNRTEKLYEEVFKQAPLFGACHGLSRSVRTATIRWSAPTNPRSRWFPNRNKKRR